MTTSEKDKALKTVVKGGSLVFVGLIISRFLGYLTRIALARVLGPEGMGLVYLAISVSGILVTMSIIGLPSAIQRYLSFYEGQKKLRKVKGVITSSLKISVPLSLTSCIILFLFSDWIAVEIFRKPVLSLALKIFAVTIPFRVLTNISDSSIKGFRIVKYNIYTRKLIEPFSKFLLVLVFLFIGYKVAAGSLGYGIGYILTGIIAFYFLERKVFSVVKTKIKSVSLKRKLIKYSWPLMLTGIMWTLVGRIDTLMIGILIEEKAPLGIYQGALPTSNFLNIAPAALSIIFLPIISNLFSKGKSGEIQDVYSTVAKWIFYINFPLLFIFLLFPNAILKILFGKEFMVGGVVLAVLSLGTFVDSFGRLSKSVVNLLKKTKLHLINSVVAVSIDIVLNFILIPKLGILGAGIATSITFVVYNIFEIIESWYYGNVHPFSLNFFKSFISVIISGGITYYVGKSFLKPYNLLNISILLLCFISIYIILLLVFRGLDKEDIMILKAMERKTGVKSEFLRKIIKKFI